MNYLRYWGKAHPATPGSIAWHPLPYHCLDVAAVVHEYLTLNPTLAQLLRELMGMSEESLRPFVVFMAAAHDLGKFDLGFQGKVESLFRQLHPDFPDIVSDRDHPHSTAGFNPLIEWLQEKLEDEGVFIDIEQELGPLVNAACGHHGKPVNSSSTTILGIRFKGARRAAVTFLEDTWRLFEVNEVPTASVTEEAKAQRSLQLAGLISLCDWVGSSQLYFPYEAPGATLHEYWPKAKARAHRALKELLLVEKRAARAGGFDFLFPHFNGNATPLQKYADTVDVCAGDVKGQLFVLEDETGAGKTEAALTLASRLMAAGKGTGVLICLPTQTTADAFCRRVLPIGQKFHDEQCTYTLAHGNSSLALKNIKSQLQHKDAIEVELSHWAMESSKTALLSDVGVCTIDQAVLSVLPSRHFVMRMVGIGRKVLVVDEAHACEPYLLGLLCTMLEHHGMRGGSAIILSATLPQATRGQLAAAFARGAGLPQPALRNNAYPLATCLGRQGVEEMPIEARNVPKDVPLKRIDEADIERLIHGWLRSGKCVLLLRNTVASAQAAFKKFEALYPGKVLLSHARFVVADRADNDKQLLNDFGKDSVQSGRAGRLVISTQVAEQSLDVDFDELITDLSPVDSMLQRIGRWRRHVRNDKGEYHSGYAGPDHRALSPVHIVMPEPSEGLNFLKRLPQGTAVVYANPKVLWRTAELVMRGLIRIAAGVREAVEYAYDDEAEVPAELEKAYLEALGKEMDAKNYSRQKSIGLQVPYDKQLLTKTVTGEAVTRLGEGSVGIILANEEGVPIRERTAELSTVRLRASLLALKLDDKGRALLKMAKAGEGLVAYVPDHKGRTREVRYSRKVGLTVSDPLK